MSNQSVVLTISPREGAHGSSPQRYAVGDDAAREIGLPLYEILATADLMREAYGDGNLEILGNRLSLLLSKSANLASSLSAIIELAKLEATPADKGTKDFDIAELLQEATQTARLIIGNKPVKVMETASPSPLLVHADCAKVRRIMMEIMCNAAKFTYRGRIAVIINKDDDLIRITVTDTGVGMTSEQIHAFFTFPERKFELDNAPVPGRGLRMVGALVSLLKGSMTVSSKLREGTIVEVSLPIAQPNKESRQAE